MIEHNNMLIVFYYVNNLFQQLASTKSNHTDWHLLDIIPKLLDMVLLPIKEQMMTRQCGQPHDHGEIQQNEKLTDYCCKFIVRIIAELAFSSKNIKVNLYFY